MSHSSSRCGHNNKAKKLTSFSQFNSYFSFKYLSAKSWLLPVRPAPLIISCFARTQYPLPMPWFGLLNSDSETVAKDQVDEVKSLDDLEAGDGNASFPVEGATTSAPLLSTTPTPCSLNSSPSSSISGAGTTESYAAAATSTVSFRPLQSSDRHRIQELHEQWFPVSYSDDFYDDLVNNHRLSTSGDQLFTCVATLNDKNISTSSDDTQLYCQTVGEDSLTSQQQQQRQFPHQSQRQEEDETMIGCAVGTFIHHSRLSPTTSELLVPNSQQHSRLFYIMTLGTVEEYRNLGVATSLIQKCMEQVEQDKTCGALYLHVIPYNDAAIRFYEKLGFYRVSTIPDYYAIDDKNYDCYLYAKYYHGMYCVICDLTVVLPGVFSGKSLLPCVAFFYYCRQSWASNIIQARCRRHLFPMASYKDPSGLVW